MRHTNLVFCLPVKEPCRPPPKPIGQDTRQCRFTTPLVGWTTPPMMLSKVDLLARFRPTRTTLNLGGMVKIMTSKTNYSVTKLRWHINLALTTRTSGPTHEGAHRQRNRLNSHT